MTDADLLRCLRGLTPEDWYHLLNERVFFWVSWDRLLRLLNARAYRNKLHDVLTADTAMLVNRYGSKITLSPINSGCTKPYPHPRGLDTFLPISEYPFEYWYQKRHGAEDAVVELAVRDGIEELADIVLRVEIMRRDELLEVVYPREHVLR
jgi:hypothetical protein